MKQLAISLAVTVLLLVQAAPVSAHVLITDESHTKGAILHVMPDDDPIAGQASTFYFDSQAQFAAGDTVWLTITDQAGETQEVQAHTQGSLATASYTFPVQGVYDLQFTVKLADKLYIYNQPQRVSRGVTASVLDQPSYDWAQLLLLASILGFAVLGIIAFNNRAQIAQHSKFK